MRIESDDCCTNDKEITSTHYVNVDRDPILNFSRGGHFEGSPF